MEIKLKAFHNDPEIKKKYLDRITAHAAADEIIKGKYWENGKGCAVGCTIHSSDHASYETELGIPQVLAGLEDGIFEDLKNDLAKTWPLRFLEAISVGADLSNIWPKFAHWMILDEKYGVIQFAKSDESKATIQRIGDLYKLKAAGSEVSIEDWKLAADAAHASTAAAYAAYAFAYNASYAAYAYAAYASYAFAAADAKRMEWRIAQSEKLIELFKEAK